LVRARFGADNAGMPRTQPTAESRGWTLVAFWAAWCAGPGVFLGVSFLIGGTSVQVMPPPWVHAFEIVRAVSCGAAALLHAVLLLVRGPHRRWPELWVLLLFWPGVVIAELDSVAADTRHAAGFASMILGAIVAAVAVLRVAASWRAADAER
jgi:hypothetical protein